MNGVKYIVDSSNKKLSKFHKVDATYASIQKTCPSTCKLKGEGCYAELGPTGIHAGRLDKESKGLTALQLARAEAKEIDSSYRGKKFPKGRNLRLHVAGDCRIPSGVRLINSAIGRWKKRGGGTAWSYTHAWDKVLREEWSNVSMLASVDSIKEVGYARQNGYAPAIVVEEHKSERAYTLKGSDVKWIPCPAQTRGVGCVECQLCLKADRLFEENKGIAFAVHGAKKNNIKKRLKVIK